MVSPNLHHLRSLQLHPHPSTRFTPTPPIPRREIPSAKVGWLAGPSLKLTSWVLSETKNLIIQGVLVKPGVGRVYLNLGDNLIAVIHHFYFRIYFMVFDWYTSVLLLASLLFIMLH